MADLLAVNGEGRALKRSALRTAALGLGVLALVLLVYLARRPAPASAPTSAAAPASEATPTSLLLPPASPRAEVATPRASATEVASDPEPSFPVPTPDQIKPRPARKPATPAGLREQKQASLELIERSIERLEKERQSAERAGDGEAAGRSVIRIQRLRKRSETLRQELAGPAPVTGEAPAQGTAPPSGP